MKASEKSFREVFDIRSAEENGHGHEEVYLFGTLLIVSEHLPENDDCLSFATYVKKSLPYIYNNGMVDIHAYQIVHFILERDQIPTQRDVDKLKLEQQLK